MVVTVTVYITLTSTGHIAKKKSENASTIIAIDLKYFIIFRSICETLIKALQFKFISRL